MGGVEVEAQASQFLDAEAKSINEVPVGKPSLFSAGLSHARTIALAVSAFSDNCRFSMPWGDVPSNRSLGSLADSSVETHSESAIKNGMGEPHRTPVIHLFQYFSHQPKTGSLAAC